MYYPTRFQPKSAFLADIFVMSKMLSSKYQVYACSRVSHTPQFQPKNHVLGRKPTRTFVLTLFLLSFFLLGCQPKVYLMPPPVGLVYNKHFFEMSSETVDENYFYTLYATNREPFEKLNQKIGYTIFPSDTLRLGFVVHSAGGEGMGWEDLKQQSLRTKRDKDLLLKQEYVKEIVQYSKGDDLGKTSPQADGFFDQINKVLDRTYDKDILVYVHGANSNFYRASAQGAQYFHYTGHNSLVITFSWPSAENILKYKVDVLHAKQTVPAFARLIEILARHTKARNINILAYSAGAQVVAPGLEYLNDLYPELPSEELKKRMRIGEVYFAAPDTDFKAFVERYLNFKDIVERTTININQNDRILRLAAFQNGVSRLGSPDGSELNEKEKNVIIAAMKTPQLDLLDVGRSKALNVGRAHDSWYNHPWVSNDLLLLFLFNADPVDRGLEKFVHESGAEGYLFPPDYDSRVKQIINEHRAEDWQKDKIETLQEVQ